MLAIQKLLTLFAKFPFWPKSTESASCEGIAQQHIWNGVIFMWKEKLKQLQFSKKKKTLQYSSIIVVIYIDGGQGRQGGEPFTSNIWSVSVCSVNSKVGGELDQMLEVVVVMLVLVELVMVVMEVVLDKEVGKKVVVGVGQSVNDQGR